MKNLKIQNENDASIINSSNPIINDNKVYLFCGACYSLASLYITKDINGNTIINTVCKNEHNIQITIEELQKLLLKNNDKSICDTCNKKKPINELLICLSCNQIMCNNCIISHGALCVSHHEKNTNQIFQKVTNFTENREKHFLLKKYDYCNKCCYQVCNFCKHEENNNNKIEDLIKKNKSENEIKKIEQICKSNKEMINYENEQIDKIIDILKKKKETALLADIIYQLYLSDKENHYNIENLSFIKKLNPISGLDKINFDQTQKNNIEPEKVIDNILVDETDIDTVDNPSTHEKNNIINEINKPKDMEINKIINVSFLVTNKSPVKKRKSGFKSENSSPKIPKRESKPLLKQSIFGLGRVQPAKTGILTPKKLRGGYSNFYEIQNNFIKGCVITNCLYIKNNILLISCKKRKTNKIILCKVSYGNIKNAELIEMKIKFDKEEYIFKDSINYITKWNNNDDIILCCSNKNIYKFKISENDEIENQIFIQSIFTFDCNRDLKNTTINKYNDFSFKMCLPISNEYFLTSGCKKGIFLFYKNLKHKNEFKEDFNLVVLSNCEKPIQAMERINDHSFVYCYDEIMSSVLKFMKVKFDNNTKNIYSDKRLYFMKKIQTKNNLMKKYFDYLIMGISGTEIGVIVINLVKKEICAEFEKGVSCILQKKLKNNNIICSDLFIDNNDVIHYNIINKIDDKNMELKDYTIIDKDKDGKICFLCKETRNTIASQNNKDIMHFTYIPKINNNKEISNLNHTLLIDEAGRIITS